MYVQYLFHTISILVSYRGRYPGVAAMIAEENYFTFIHIPASCHKQYLQNASYNLIDEHVGHFLLSVNQNHFVVGLCQFLSIWSFWSYKIWRIMVVFSTHDVTVTWHEINPGLFFDFAHRLCCVWMWYKFIKNIESIYNAIHLNIKISNVGIYVFLPNNILKIKRNWKYLKKSVFIRSRHLIWWRLWYYAKYVN